MSKPSLFACREQNCPCGQWQIDWRKQLPKHVQKDKFDAVQTILQEVTTTPGTAAAIAKSSANDTVCLTGREQYCQKTGKSAP